MLQPNGTVILTFLVSSPSYDIYETLSEMPEYKNYTRNIKSFVSPYHHEIDPLKLFENHFKSAGFQGKHVEIRERSFVYDPEQLRSKYTARFSVSTIECNFYTIFPDSVKAVNPFTEGMPECLSEQFLDDYVKIANQIGDNEVIRECSTIVSRYQLMVAVLTKQSRI